METNSGLWAVENLVHSDKWKGIGLVFLLELSLLKSFLRKFYFLLTEACGESNVFLLTINEYFLLFLLLVSKLKALICVAKGLIWL